MSALLRQVRGLSESETMNCSCGAKAIWKVGERGYCREHKEQAYRAQFNIARRIDLGRAEDETPEWRRARQRRRDYKIGWD